MPDPISLVSFGVVAGALIISLWNGSRLEAPDLLNAIVTIGAALWIQAALTRQAEVNRVPLSTVSRLFDKLESLIYRSVEAAATGRPSPESTALLLAASIETDWLRSLLARLQLDPGEHLALVQDYISLKVSLTDTTIDLVGARAAANAIRLRCFRLQLTICKHLVDNPSSSTQI